MIIRALLVAVVLLAPVFLVGCGSVSEPREPNVYDINVYDISVGNYLNFVAPSTASDEVLKRRINAAGRDSCGHEQYALNKLSIRRGWEAEITAHLDCTPELTKKRRQEELEKQIIAAEKIRKQKEEETIARLKRLKREQQSKELLAHSTNYVGEHRDDKAHGQGTYTFADGDKYVGEWKDNKMHGQGTYTFADGVVWQGTFANDDWVSGHKYSKAEWQQVERRRIAREKREQERREARRQEAERELLAEQARVREKVKREKRAMQSRSQTCLGFGFKEGSDPHSQCMFDLFRLEQSAAQNLAMQQKLQTMQAEAVAAEERYNRKLRLLEKEIENKEVAQAYQREVQAMKDEAARNAASQNALLEKHLRQFNEQLQAERNFQEGMAILQYGLNMIDPPRTTTTCRWNAAMQTMTCN